MNVYVLYDRVGQVLLGVYASLEGAQQASESGGWMDAGEGFWIAGGGEDYIRAFEVQP